MDYRKTASVVLASFVAAPFATAEGTVAPPAERVTERSLGASYNRLGLQHVFAVRWTRPLTRSRRPLLEGARVSGGFAHTLSPSYMRVAAWGEVAPLSILSVRAGFEPALYFGTFDSLSSYGSYHSVPGSSASDTRCTASCPGAGGRVYLSPALTLRVGTLALASTASMEWWRSSAAGPFYYEPSRDTLLRASGDRLLTVSTVLVRQVPGSNGGQLTYGVSYDLTEVFAAPENRSQRVGVVAKRRLASKHLGLQSPSIGVRVAYYIQDPRRKGQLAAAVGVSVEGRR